MRPLPALALALAAALGLLSAFSPARALDLRDDELRWLEGAWPVVSQAQQAGMPLDIVVQPQDTPGLAPMGLAFVGGRCKLVLSLRGNALAVRAQASIEPDLFDSMLALMAAHELGHCRRWLDGAWHGVPAGFSPSAPQGLPPAQRAAWDEMQATRLEEAFGDLVGLAWVQRERPAHYARLHAWLLRERGAGLPGDHHDTRAWLERVADGRVLEGASIFDRPAALWREGLAPAR